MGRFALAVFAGLWMAEALALGYLMARRGYEPYKWRFLGTVLGPIAVAIALASVMRPAPDARLIRGGRRRAGAIDVLIGIDGSPESTAAIDRSAALFGAALGRVTLARVVPVDATPETEQMAEAQLSAACAAHPELDPAAVVLRGEPVEALRDYVRRLGYEVLVVGTRGEGKTHAVLGSVAMKLARGAGIPVLLVDAAAAGDPTATRTGALA